MSVYQEVIKMILLSGPTNLKPFFEQILDNFIYISTNSPYNYYVVWIFIDSDIDDIESTLKLMENADMCGISVIILGIGKDTLLLP